MSHLSEPGNTECPSFPGANELLPSVCVSRGIDFYFGIIFHNHIALRPVHTINLINIDKVTALQPVKTIRLKYGFKIIQTARHREAAAIWKPKMNFGIVWFTIYYIAYTILFLSCRLVGKSYHQYLHNVSIAISIFKLRSLLMCKKCGKSKCTCK